MELIGGRLGRSSSNGGLPWRSLLTCWRRWHRAGRVTLFERVGPLAGSLCPNACMGVKQQCNNSH